MESVSKPFAKKIRDLRRLNNLTQKQLADKIGVDNTTVSKWESSIYEPNSELLDKLALVFNTSVDEILGRTTQIHETSGRDSVPIKRSQVKSDSETDFHFFDTEGVQFIARSKKNLSPQAYQKMQELAKKAKELFEDDEED